MAGGNDSRFFCSCGLTFPNAERFDMHLIHGVNEAHRQVDPPPPVSHGFLPDWLEHYRAQQA